MDIRWQCHIKYIQPAWGRMLIMECHTCVGAEGCGIKMPFLDNGDFLHVLITKGEWSNLIYLILQGAEMVSNTFIL